MESWQVAFFFRVRGRKPKRGNLIEHETKAFKASVGKRVKRVEETKRIQKMFRRA